LHPRFPAFAGCTPLAFSLLALDAMSTNPSKRPSFGAAIDVLQRLQRDVAGGTYLLTTGATNVRAPRCCACLCADLI